MKEIGILNQTHDGKIERPIAITVICILGFIGAGLSIPMVLSDIARQIGDWFPPYSGTVGAISLICMIGLWFTKKWVMYAYTSLIVLNQIVLITMNMWNILTLAIQGVIVAVILFHFEPKIKILSHQSIRYVRRQIWAIVVAYMVGIHNFYKGEEKTQDNIVITIENNEEQEDDGTKD
ncbi:MAG: hypothetical protein RJQ14_17330 [Marinoscillum sp.]